MATKFQRIRSIVGLAVAAVKGIFRTGKAWGTTRTRVVTARRTPATAATGAALAVGVAGGAAGVYFLDPKNGQERRRAVGKRVPAIDRVVALARRDSSQEEAEDSADTKAAQTAAGNGAGAPAPAKEAVAAAS